MLTGGSNGSPFSHKHVALVSPVPNIHGCTIWSGLRMAVLILPTGFSSAILGIGAPSKNLTKSSASACSCALPFHHLAPLEARYVQGGKAIIRSHCQSGLSSHHLISPSM